MVVDFCKKLVYNRLEICIAPSEDVHMEGWIGAILRNNLLFMAEQVIVKKGISLLAEIDRFPLVEGHPLYTSLIGGFPKGFSLAVLSPEKEYASQIFLRKGEKVIFSLVLMGDYIHYYKDFVFAIRGMCERGMGTPRVPWTLHEIYERDGLGRAQRVAVGFSGIIAPLRFPVKLEDFEEEKFGCVDKLIELHFTAPVLLTRQINKKDNLVSYQDKLNGFPSFYQFVRSAIYRCIKLVALYICPQDKEAYIQAEQDIENYIEKATSAWLKYAELRWVKMCGPKRDDGRLPIIFAGYTGKLVYAGDFCDFTSFLTFMQAIGVGNDTIYGLGNYKLKVLKNNKLKSADVL